MNKAEITYEEFINDLRISIDATEVLNLIDRPDDNLIIKLIEIVDSFNNGNKYYEAEKILQVLANTFNEHEFYSSLAYSQKKQYKFNESKLNYEKSIALNPSKYITLYNYGILLCELKEFEKAIEVFKQSIELNENCYLCYYNLGNCYREIDDFKKAKDAYEEVIRLNNDYEDAVYNLGVVEEELNNISKAISYYEKAIDINNNNIQAHWNKALLLLQRGEFISGFKEYEWRLKKKEFYRYFPFPNWKGEDLTNKKILMYCEQGYGDAIQFIRFAKNIKAENITVECRDGLKPLFESIDFINNVVLRESAVYKKDDFDFYVSIMSLPFTLNLDINNIGDLPYIYAGRLKKETWERTILSSEKYKIGIVFSGNPAHQNDKNRSIDPELVLDKLKDENISLYSLQMNPSKKLVEIISQYGVIDLTEGINDFSDTAGLISQLDLIISVDTSVAHLAGAMGKETWILLPSNPDWRWLLNKTNSQWYKSVKLFRQTNKNDWHEVLKDIKKNLDHKLSAKNSFNNNNNDNDETKFDKLYTEIELLINSNELESALKKIEFILNDDHSPYRAFNLLGVLFAKTKNYMKAEEYFNKSINIFSGYSDVYSNMGITKFELGNYEESIKYHTNAIKLNNSSAKSYFNLAYAYQEMGEIEKAETNYNNSIMLNPTFDDAQFNLALLKLLRGNYKDNWRDYNYWAFISGNRTIRNVNNNLWKGENFKGKKLFIYPDQGLGDIIQLIRYLPLVKERGGEVIFECQPVLYELLKSYKGIDKIIRTKDNLEITEVYDYHVPMQNLPEIFETTLDTIPNYQNSLTVSKEIKEKWKKIVSSNKNFKIGFVWKGNPFPPINRKRHAQLAEFIPLFQLKDVDFYNLQLNLNDDENIIINNHSNIYDYTNEIKNFEDTAAIINHLDLVISIDTSVAHLAGAMNKKAFIMLPFIPDWRWGLSIDSTPWYPSMKLFRQSERGNWNNVINNIISEIKKEVQNQWTQ